MDASNGRLNFSQTTPRSNFGNQFAPPTEPPVSMLADQLQTSIGYYVICDFLIGTQLIETRAGILNRVGTNYLTLYQPNLDRYIVCDLYSLKFITIYNSTEVPDMR